MIPRYYTYSYVIGKFFLHETVKVYYLALFVRMVLTHRLTIFTMEELSNYLIEGCVIMLLSHLQSAQAASLVNRLQICSKCLHNKELVLLHSLKFLQTLAPRCLLRVLSALLEEVVNIQVPQISALRV